MGPRAGRIHPFLYSARRPPIGWLGRAFVFGAGQAAQTDEALRVGGPIRAKFLIRNGKLDLLQQRSDADRDWGEGGQWTKERKPMVFMERCGAA